MKTILLQIGIFDLAILLSFFTHRWIQTWLIRHEIKRLKTAFAKLQQAVLQAEQMKSAIRSWTLDT